MTIFVGGDASKGYADFCFMAETGQVLLEFKADDTRAGHDEVIKALSQLADEQGCQFVVGLESSGGVERNWLVGFRAVARELSAKVIHINPLFVKNHRERGLHRNITDASSARMIADLLRCGHNPKARGNEYDEVRRLQTHVDGLIGQCGQLKTELQGVLVNSHPELVKYCRGKIPQWFLSLLKLCPTMRHLNEISADELAKLPYITSARAVDLMGVAQQSVASATGYATEIVILSLATQIESLSRSIVKIKAHLDQLFEDDRTCEILRSLPGIGPATAMTLRLYYGDFSTFHSEAAVVAFAGLDPRILQSGDGEKHIGISRRGQSRIRAKLYMGALASVRMDTVFRNFQQKLLNRGKAGNVALVAVMAKLLRISYACVMKDQLFDPNHQAATRPCRPQGVEIHKKGPLGLEAPISRREAQKRKRAAAHV